MAEKSLTLFEKKGNSFSGPGWEKILTQANHSNDILIGEDHFTSEIPYFTSAIARQIHFDNFFCEIDPFSARLIQQKIKSLTATELQEFVDTYCNTFSFYAYKPELELLKQLTKSDTQIKGTDQILLIGDRLLCSEMQQRTRNASAKQIYSEIGFNSKQYFERFLKDQRQPFYLLTEDFNKHIQALSALKLSDQERKVITALKMSAKIYKTQSHELRVQLMKHQLMETYADWYTKRNLFKYGANHLSKGESFLEIYDTGNLVSNINDAAYKKSLHIMILGASGTQASPFEGFPDEQIDPGNSMLLALKPIVQVVKGQQWHCFDLAPLRTAVANGELMVKDLKLQRVLKGYDLLIIIPKVTASQFASNRKHLNN